MSDCPLCEITEKYYSDDGNDLYVIGSCQSCPSSNLAGVSLKTEYKVKVIPITISEIMSDLSKNMPNYKVNKNNNSKKTYNLSLEIIEMPNFSHLNEEKKIN